jgi:hypothetical protein
MILNSTFTGEVNLLTSIGETDNLVKLKLHKKV